MDHSDKTTRTGRWTARDSNRQTASNYPSPCIFRPHPNLSDSINDNIIRSEIEGGANLNSLTSGTTLEVETRHRHYRIEYRGDGEALISGHPHFCPKPILVRITGSTWGGSMLWLRYIGRGMHLEFAHPIYGRVITSPISEIRVVNEDQRAPVAR
jgi:hypothetical protein